MSTAELEQGGTAECVACKGTGGSRCPNACHGFGRCRYCGDTGRVECTWCHGTTRVPPTVADMQRRLRGSRR